MVDFLILLSFLNDKLLIINILLKRILMIKEVE